VCLSPGPHPVGWGAPALLPTAGPPASLVATASATLPLALPLLVRRWAAVPSLRLLGVPAPAIWLPLLREVPRVLHWAWAIPALRRWHASKPNPRRHNGSPAGHGHGSGGHEEGPSSAGGPCCRRAPPSRPERRSRQNVGCWLLLRGRSAVPRVLLLLLWRRPAITVLRPTMLWTPILPCSNVGMGPQVSSSSSSSLLLACLRLMIKQAYTKVLMCA
jgi:hypothetical protein